MDWDTETVGVVTWDDEQNCAFRVFHWCPRSDPLCRTDQIIADTLSRALQHGQASGGVEAFLRTCSAQGFDRTASMKELIKRSARSLLDAFPREALPELTFYSCSRSVGETLTGGIRSGIDLPVGLFLTENGAALQSGPSREHATRDLLMANGTQNVPGILVEEAGLQGDHSTQYHRKRLDFAAWTVPGPAGLETFNTACVRLRSNDMTTDQDYHSLLRLKHMFKISMAEFLASGEAQRCEAEDWLEVATSRVQNVFELAAMGSEWELELDAVDPSPVLTEKPSYSLVIGGPQEAQGQAIFWPSLQEPSHLDRPHAAAWSIVRNG